MAADMVLLPVINQVRAHGTYLFKAGVKVKALEDATNDLVNKRDDIKGKIDMGERKGETATEQVKGWLQKVEKVKAEAEAIGKNTTAAKNGGTSSGSKYTIGKSAAKKLMEAQKLYENEALIGEITKKLPPPLVQEVATTSSGSSSMMDYNLQLALQDLKDDDEVGTIGIWGMGGVGKTHLLNKINNSFIGDECFNLVIHVTASKDCSVVKVQQAIAKKLGLSRANDVESQAIIIFNFLNKRSFLLLLDDLWERLDLKAVGVPTPLGVVGEIKQKVVLTTRSDEVCGQMNVSKTIKVDCLKEEGAWQLFQESVGEETLNSDATITKLARDIIHELGGLPLALITVGHAMHAKKHYRAWEGAIELLKESQLHEIDCQPNAKESTTFHILKFSYESLESDTLRQCFLSCSMWPEDYKIQKEELIQSWIGLGLVKVSRTLRSAYNIGYTLIDKLKASCLLEDSTSYETGDESVKMHDVLRDMALWIARDYGENNNKWIIKADIGPVENISNEIERISVMNISYKTLPFPYGILPPLTKLTTLILRSYELHERGVLVNIKAFDALTYLDLEDNFLKEFPVEICKLAKLQYLNLNHNRIESLPEELKSLTSLKYLHLKENFIHTISKDAFSKLYALQELNLFNLGGIGCPPSLLEELKSLNNLRALGITAEPAFFFMANFLGNLNHFEIWDSNMIQILIQRNGENGNSHLDLEILCFSEMRDLKTIVWKGVSPKDVFPKLRRLEFFLCDNIDKVSWIVHLPCLRELKISYCLKLKYAICSRDDNDGEDSAAERQEEGGGTLIPTFPCLEIMKLIHLKSAKPFVIRSHLPILAIFSY
ncbi:probable disease resistance protein At1g15890 [Typha latifolia]|uniref:probable disease resistance protein At1g15890 n=1 Tax=Typha latifolia TaxID=4733 RepID=UPI003C30BFF2